MSTDAHWERDQALSLAVIAGAREAGFDMTPVYRSHATTYGALPGILAVAYLIERPGAVPAEDHPLIVAGVSAARCAEPLRSLLTAQPLETRQAILHQTMLGGNSLRVMDLSLDETTLKKLVAFATGPWAVQFREQVLALLEEHAGEPGVDAAIGAIRGRSTPQ
jgi:hypothetical protein